MIIIITKAHFEGEKPSPLVTHHSLIHSIPTSVCKHEFASISCKQHVHQLLASMWPRDLAGRVAVDDGQQPCSWAPQLEPTGASCWSDWSIRPIHRQVSHQCHHSLLGQPSNCSTAPIWISWDLTIVVLLCCFHLKDINTNLGCSLPQDNLVCSVPLES